MITKSQTKGLFWGLLSFLFVGFTMNLLIETHNANKKARAERAASAAVVLRWVEKLDSMTTDAGVYVHWVGEETEPDFWGNDILVTYSKGGSVEIVSVRSMGPDGVSHTGDDIWSERKAINMSGFGSGLQEGLGKTAENIVIGIKNGLKKDKNGGS